MEALNAVSKIRVPVLPGKAVMPTAVSVKAAIFAEMENRIPVKNAMTGIIQMETVAVQPAKTKALNNVGREKNAAMEEREKVFACFPMASPWGIGTPLE